MRGFEEKVREALEEGRRSVDLRVDVTGSGGEDVKVDWVTGVRKEADGMVQERVVEKSGIAGGVESGQVQTVVEEETEGEVTERSEVEQQIDKAIRSERGRMAALKDKFEDLFSERQVVVRRWDLTALALEGAAAGMTIAGVIILIWRPR